MGFLTEAQTAAIKTVRARAWNQPFEVWTYPVLVANEMFGPIVGDPVKEELFGDWRWSDQMHAAFRTGGVIEEGDVFLACDIVHGPKFRTEAAVRIKVEEVLCMVMGMTEYPGSGEVVVHARRIRGDETP